MPSSPGDLQVIASKYDALIGEDITLRADLTDPHSVPEDATSLSWLVRDPLGVETDHSGSVVSPGAGIYELVVNADSGGEWTWRLVTNGFVAVAEGSFLVADQYAVIPDPTAPTDLHVLVPRAKRYCEGPYGPPAGRSPLQEQQLYEMCADACGDLILYTGQQWQRRLLVTQRDPRAGFPTGWATDGVLDEWEASLVTSQVALNYFFFVFRDLKTSQAYRTEGTEWSYTLSVNIIRDYIAMLQAARDLAIKGMMKHQPVYDLYVSNIRVRDRATVTLLEWWDTTSRGASAGGLPGGQEAAVIPWTW